MSSSARLKYRVVKCSSEEQRDKWALLLSSTARIWMIWYDMIWYGKDKEFWQIRQKTAWYSEMVWIQSTSFGQKRCSHVQICPRRAFNSLSDHHRQSCARCAGPGISSFWVAYTLEPDEGLANCTLLWLPAGRGHSIAQQWKLVNAGARA